MTLNVHVFPISSLIEGDDIGFGSCWCLFYFILSLSSLTLHQAGVSYFIICAAASHLKAAVWGSVDLICNCYESNLDHLEEVNRYL